MRWAPTLDAGTTARWSIGTGRGRAHTTDRPGCVVPPDQLRGRCTQAGRVRQLHGKGGSEPIVSDGGLSCFKLGACLSLQIRSKDQANMAMGCKFMDALYAGGERGIWFRQAFDRTARAQC